MKLFDFFQHIQEEKGLSTVDFIELVPMSNGLYYDIKGG